MVTIVEKTDIIPAKCPLCGNDNNCFNLNVDKKNSDCWCNDPALKFPPSLLSKLPLELQGNACICKACVLKHIAQLP